MTFSSMTKNRNGVSRPFRRGSSLLASLSEMEEVNLEELSHHSYERDGRGLAVWGSAESEDCDEPDITTVA